LEWVVVDDGTDPIEDLLSEFHGKITYQKLQGKHTIGHKRNLSHALAKGDILINFDDDDWYPPTRIEHAVNVLQQSEAEVAGCSIVHLYVPSAPMCSLGPYHRNHATAATFAFKRSLLDSCSYTETSASGEEHDFLKGYTVPLVQLDPIQTIVVFPHDHNTVDKLPLLSYSNRHFKVTNRTLAMFGMPEDLQTFYANVNAALIAYPEGKPVRCSPDTVVQFNNVELNKQDVVALLNRQHSYILQLRKELEG
jgi:glycosyltransferase involved in cell wall biosynthesis